MSFDQAIYSFQYSGGEPPTPTRTPTSPSFFLNSFETPKQDPKDQDLRSPWGNAFQNALSPSFKTPNFATFSPTTPTQQEPAITGKNVEAQIATHEQLSQISNTLGAFDGSGQLTDLPLDFSQYSLDQTNPQDALKASIDTQVSSAGSIQTPPPTSTSASRRKVEKVQATRVSKNNASNAGRRMSFPATGQKDQVHSQIAMLDDSPLQYPNLQLSPDNISFSASCSGPATAPVYPQQKIFWDADQDTNALNLDVPLDDNFNAFGILNQRELNAFAQDHTPAGFAAFNTTPQAGGLEPFTSFAQSSHAPALNQTNISPTTAVVTQGKHRGFVVNPSLLFSSPSQRAAQTDTQYDDPEPIDDSFIPYELQRRAAQAEQEYQSRKQKRKRPPELGESPAVKAAIEALREDRTDSSKSSPVLADSFFGALPNGPPQFDEGLPSRKRMTPDNHYKKSAGQTSLHRRRSTKTPVQRRAVTLEIDETGRASTKTSIIKDYMESPMETDSESGDSDSSSESDDEMALSQNQSFMRPASRQKPTRKARFADEPYSHSQRSSDASTLASARTASSSGRRSGSVMNTGQVQARSGRLQSFAGHGDDSEIETEVDSDEDGGEAQAQLKKVVRHRSQRKSSVTSSSTLKHNQSGRRHSYLSEVQTANPYYNTHRNPASHGMYPDLMTNSSPATITDPDLTTPNSRVSNGSDGSTRCVCNVADGNGQLMIQW